MTAIFHKCLETIELLFDYYNQNEREANEMEELKDNDVEKKIEEVKDKKNIEVNLKEKEIEQVKDDDTDRKVGEMPTNDKERETEEVKDDDKVKTKEMKDNNNEKKTKIENVKGLFQRNNFNTLQPETSPK